MTKYQWSILLPHTLPSKWQRKLMSFSLSFGCQSLLGAVTHQPNVCPLSSVTLERFQFGSVIINTADCDKALQVKSLNATTLLLPHSFRHEWGMSFMLNHSCSLAASLWGVWGFPSLPGCPTPTLCSQSALLFYERLTSCTASSDTLGKELWHRVISPGHVPSADVRKQSHSCRWNFALHKSIRGAVQFPLPRRCFLT